MTFELDEKDERPLTSTVDSYKDLWKSTGMREDIQTKKGESDVRRNQNGS